MWDSFSYCFIQYKIMRLFLYIMGIVLISLLLTQATW